MTSWLRMWAISCGDDPLKLIPIQDRQEAFRNRVVRASLVQTGSKCIGVGIGDNPNRRLGQSGGDCHFLNNVPVTRVFEPGCMKEEGEIAPEAYPGEETQKDGDQKLRAPSIRPLLSEEIRIGHSLGLKERAT